MKTFLLLPLLLIGLFAQEPSSVQDPQELPVCKDIAGAEVVWSDFDEHAIVLYFHKPGLEYSTRGLEDLLKKLSTKSETHFAVAIVIIGFEDSDLSAAAQALKHSGLPGAVVLDKDRSAFGYFHVKAYPTAHIMDRQHQEVAVARGFGPHFVFRVHLAARFAAGEIDQQQYEKLLAGGKVKEIDPNLVKLHRKVGLARRLALGGKPGQGLALLEKAIQNAEGVAPDASVLNLAIRLNLLEGEVSRAAELLEELQLHFPKADAIPFLRCRLALAEGDLEKASAAVKGKRARLEPEAVLLRGLILEAQDQCDKAAQLYREELEKQALAGV